MKLNIIWILFLIINIIPVYSCIPPLEPTPGERNLLKNSPKIVNVSLTSDPEVLEIEVQTNESQKYKFQYNIQEETVLSEEEYLPSGIYSPNITIPNDGRHLELWGMRDNENNSTLITIYKENELIGNYTILNRFFDFINNENLTRIDFSNSYFNNATFYSKSLDTLFIPTNHPYDPTIENYALGEYYYSFDLNGSNLYHIVTLNIDSVQVIQFFNIAQFANNSLTTYPSSRFFDDENILYFQYGDLVCSRPHLIFRYNKTSIEITQGSFRSFDLFDSRVKHVIQWFNEYDFEKLIYEGLHISIGNYMNTKRVRLIIPFEIYPVYLTSVNPIESTSNSFPAPWIAIIFTIPLLIVSRRKKWCLSFEHM